MDLRARPLEQAKHWKNERLASRAQFDTSAASTAAFMLSNVSEDDDGIYRCRVDFRHTPTRHVRYQLNVVRKFRLLSYLSGMCVYILIQRQFINDETCLCNLAIVQWGKQYNPPKYK